ncbi:MAG: hypothetical protein ACK514_16960 [Bacteroidota bacterium]|nr:hypothetical protein [Cytophagales bacterium]MCZ8070336.1 hypothetical protein [Cytophagales bacterium]
MFESLIDSNRVKEISSKTDKTFITSNDLQYYNSDTSNFDMNFWLNSEIKDSVSLKIFINAFSIHQQIPRLKCFELFKTKKDNSPLLIFKGLAKRVTGESPYEDEFYLVNGDTLIGDSSHPVYYYFEELGLKVIEQYQYDRVESCSFTKELRYFSNNTWLATRAYNYSLNCWKSNEIDSAYSNYSEVILLNNERILTRKLQFYVSKQADDQYFVAKSEADPSLLSNDPLPINVKRIEK